MKVTWVWQVSCADCKQMEEYVLPSVKAVLRPLRDVMWVSRNMEHTRSYSQIRGGGTDWHVENEQFTLHMMNDLEEVVEYTPTAVLELADAREVVGFEDMVNFDHWDDKAFHSNQVKDNPTAVAHRFVYQVFAFYVRNQINAIDDTIPEVINGHAPDYNHGEFNPNEWKRAFVQVKHLQ